MVKQNSGLSKPKVKRTEPREIRASSAAPRPTENQLEEVVVDGIELGGCWQSAAAEPGGIWPEERSLDLDGSPVEGWVAGLPVVDGVADSGWKECKGGRVRLVVRVMDCPEQREWVRAMAYGGAYAKEVMG